ncbi:MAG: DUF554 domain-containing protein [Erysipelotrichaceae bacterium]|nr:DUF554 domain-containing protein [Erysipelotrichaceae bacterium]
MIGLLGTIVNAFTVLLGTTIGFFFKKGIPKDTGDVLMKALGLCTVIIGISGALKGEKTLVMILSMVIGTFIGQTLDLDAKINRFVKKIENKYAGEGEYDLTKAFITSSLLFCVGSMTIVGSLNAGLKGDNTMLYTKSVLDLTSSMIFASTLGPGVYFSILFIIIYQGGLTLLASFLAPILTTTVITEMTCVGSLIIIGTGTNLLGITDLKLMNFLPSMFLPILFCLFM